jgi:hypothetical protein
MASLKRRKKEEGSRKQGTRCKKNGKSENFEKRFTQSLHHQQHPRFAAQWSTSA